MKNEALIVAYSAGNSLAANQSDSATADGVVADGAVPVQVTTGSAIVSDPSSAASSSFSLFGAVKPFQTSGRDILT
jgi:hypothetical protein